MMGKKMSGGLIFQGPYYSSLFLFLLINCVICISGTDLMFEVAAGRQDCFFESVEANKTLYVDYSVVSSNQGELDINFQLSDIHGRPIISEFRKTESRHELVPNEKGYYKACFDNTFSHFSHKTVAFHISVENDEDTNWNDYDDNNFQPDVQVYDVQVNDIKAIMERVRVHLNKIQGTQDTFRMLELRDRVIAESNFERVNFWSMLYMLILIFVGVLQVLLLKSMFDEKSYLRKYISKFKR